MEAAQDLAYRYDVADLLGPLLNFDPEIDTLNDRPYAPKPQVSRSRVSSRASLSVELDQLISPASSPSGAFRKSDSLSERSSESPTLRLAQQRGIDEFSPIYTARVRSQTRVSQLSKMWSEQQEPTPHYHSSPLSGKEKYYSEAALQRCLFPQNSVDFDTLVGSNESSGVLTTEMSQRTASFTFSSLEQRCKEILMGIFVNGDEYLSELFENLRDPDQPDKFNVNMTLDERNSTPLHWAVACGRIKTVELLLLRGANPLQVAQEGETPLMRAITTYTNYHNETLGCLLDLMQESAFVSDESGRTILHYAAFLSNIRSKRPMARYYTHEILELLERLRLTSDRPILAFINAKDIHGHTALHVATQLRCHSIAQMLLRSGANPFIKDNNGESPAEIGQDARFKRLFSLNPNVVYGYDDVANVDDYSDAPTTPVSSPSSPLTFPETAEDAQDNEQDANHSLAQETAAQLGKVFERNSVPKPMHPRGAKRRGSVLFGQQANAEQDAVTEDSRDCLVKKKRVDIAKQQLSKARRNLVEVKQSQANMMQIMIAASEIDRRYGRYCDNETQLDSSVSCMSSELNSQSVDSAVLQPEIRLPSIFNREPLVDPKEEQPMYYPSATASIVSECSNNEKTFESISDAAMLEANMIPMTTEEAKVVSDAEAYYRNDIESLKHKIQTYHLNHQSFLGELAMIEREREQKDVHYKRLISVCTDVSQKVIDQFFDPSTELDL